MNFTKNRGPSRLLCAVLVLAGAWTVTGAWAVLTLADAKAFAS